MTVIASASKVEVAKTNKEEKDNNGRRDLVFGAAAAVAYSIARAAMADDEEPKRGTPAAKKKYASVCVTNPTARICRY
ncbi:Photosystem II 5 kDa protein, chloroplastic [Linum grandiflorum]